MENELEKRAEALAARSYTEIIIRDRTTDDDHIYVAFTLELDGCMAQGETVDEARENLRLIRIDYILHLLENHLDVPPPRWASDNPNLGNVQFDGAVMGSESSFEIAVY